MPSKIRITLFALCLVFVAALVGVSAQTTHQVVLTWTASTVPTGAPPVTQYNILRGSTSGGEGSTPIGTSTTPTYTDTTVVAGSTYFYAVTAQNQCNGAAPIAPCVSAKSNEVGPLVIPNNVAPNAPTNLTGTAQ
jgi:fibronectin type 3 domain-containing protein